VVGIEELVVDERLQDPPDEVGPKLSAKASLPDSDLGEGTETGECGCACEMVSLLLASKGRGRRCP
jgi:hypothetical protein